MSLRDIFDRTSSDEDVLAFERGPAIVGGAGSGFLATVATSIPILLINVELLSTTIAGLYGLEGSLLAGIIIHLVHGTLFGLVFAFVLSDPMLVRISGSRLKTLLAGIVYAFLLAIIGTGFIMPVWLNAIGLADAPSVWFITEGLLAWHLTYGIVLGLLYPWFEGYSRNRPNNGREDVE